MLIIDLIQETYLSLSANKSRSALTILGIIIGIGSVIAMISVGQGATQDIEKNIQSLGSNLLIVMPGSQKGVGSMVRGGMGSANTLTKDDAIAIAEIANVEKVAATVSARKQVLTKGKNTNTSITGIDENYWAIKNIEAESGALINAQQVKAMVKVAVLGPTTKSDLFGESEAVGQKIRAGGQEFTVIGVTKSKGGSGFGSSDDLIYIPLNVAQRYFLGNDSVSAINIQVVSADLMTAVQEEVDSLLLARHKINDPAQADFSIMNQADIMSAMSSVTGTMTLLLGAIAGISLLVGGIGIMNMMLTTVSERTREIGLRKSLGAKRRDINLQFLAEAVALTFLGGLLGILFGWLSSKLISQIAGLTTVVSFSSVLLAFVVSAAIGIVFGYYPARKAARLNPIEALRYE